MTFSAMLGSNVGHFVPESDRGSEPYVALRLLPGLLSALAVLAVIVGGFIAVVIVLLSIQGHTRESTGVQRATLAELRRIGNAPR